MRIGAVYIRVSTHEQEEYSPDAQLKRIKEYAQKNDILIMEEYIYVENGVSGRTVEKREEFKKMIATAKIKPKPFDTVLIHAYDRFARNVKESRIYKELLRDDLGIELISITEDFGVGKNSFLMEGIKDILNEYYSLNLRDEVLKGMTEKADRGELMTSASFGYKAINNKLEIVEEEARIVKLIYDMYANTNNGLLDIAKYINSLGIKTKRGNMFENRTIKYILRNPVYIGMFRWSRKGRIDYHCLDYKKETTLTKSTHTPIIDLNTWNTVQNKLEKNRIYSKPHQNNSNECWHWLQGLIKCAYCNKTYVSIQTHKKMRCNGYNKGICSNGTSIKVFELEQLILNQIQLDFLSKRNLTIHKVKTKDNNERDLIEKQISSLDQKYDRIKSSYINGIDTLEEYKSNKELISKEINLLKTKLKKIEVPKIESIKDIKFKSKNMYDILTDNSISMEDKRNALNKIIKEVIINPDTMEIVLEYISSPI